MATPREPLRPRITPASTAKVSPKPASGDDPPPRVVAPASKATPEGEPGRGDPPPRVVAPASKVVPEVDRDGDDPPVLRRPTELPRLDPHDLDLEHPTRGTVPVDDDPPVAPPPVEPAPAPETSASTVPDGALVWENRSGEPGSGYAEMLGPDEIVYSDGVWYARGEDGELHAFHEGRYLDFSENDSPYSLEALEFESLSGTGLWGMGRPQHLGLQLDGETGDFVTEAGVAVDPDALAVVRAADGSVLVYDAENETWARLDALGEPILDVPDGPYTTLVAGEGAAPPLDELSPGTSLVFDPEDLTYADPDSGGIVGFHETLQDDLRVWENRSGDEDSYYAEMQGPEDIVYVNDVWYARGEDGELHAFHEGRYLDFTEIDSPFSLEALEYESVAGTPMAGVGLPGHYGLVLDGETGGFVDGDGDPVDLSSFDPTAPPDEAFGAEAFGDGAAADLVTADPADDFGAGALVAADVLDDPADPDDAGDPADAFDDPADGFGGDEVVGTGLDDDGDVFGAGLDDEGDLGGSVLVDADVDGDDGPADDDLGG